MSGSNSGGRFLPFSSRICGSDGSSLNFHVLSVFDVYFSQDKFDNLISDTMASSSLPVLVASGKDKMDPRLLALCCNQNVSDAMMDKLGDNGLTSATMLKNTFKDKDDWRDSLTKPPFDLSGTDFATKLEIGRLVGVFEACCATNEVEVKANAERIRQNLPPEINIQEILQSQKIFEAAHFELTKAMLPSKGYFERMVLQVEVGFEEVSLTTVTNLSQDDVNDNPNEMRFNTATGQGTRSQKQYFIPLPKNSEELRARFRTFAICWVFMKMKFPSKAQLRTVSVEVIDRYVEWLFGPKVWGLAAMENGKPISTPTIELVMPYDLQIRKKMAEFMNSGHDFKAALDAAKNPEKEGMEIRQVHFLSPVAINITTPACKACSAPGIRETYGNVAKKESEGPKQGAASASTIGKKTIKKIKQAAKIEAEKNAAMRAIGNGAPGGQISNRAKKRAAAQAKQQLALQNGGVGDGTAGVGTRGAQFMTQALAKGKGKGKDMHEGTPICYNWNKGVACKRTPCLFAHVCLICKSEEHGKHNHP